MNLIANAAVEVSTAVAKIANLYRQEDDLLSD